VDVRDRHLTVNRPDGRVDAVAPGAGLGFLVVSAPLFTAMPFTGADGDVFVVLPVLVLPVLACGLVVFVCRRGRPGGAGGRARPARLARFVRSSRPVWYARFSRFARFVWLARPARPVPPARLARLARSVWLAPFARLVSLARFVRSVWSARLAPPVPPVRHFPYGVEVERFVRGTGAPGNVDLQRVEPEGPEFADVPVRPGNIGTDR
jgi:hypothetical protein